MAAPKKYTIQQLIDALTGRVLGDDASVLFEGINAAIEQISDDERLNVLRTLTTKLGDVPEEPAEVKFDVNELSAMLKDAVAEQCAPVLAFLQSLQPQPNVTLDREAMLKRRYQRHAVTDDLTLVFMRHYVPNLLDLPSGFVVVGEPISGKTYVLYFKLYTTEDLNPVKPWSGPGRNMGYEEAGPNRGYGLNRISQAGTYWQVIATRKIQACVEILGSCSGWFSK